MNTRLEYWFPRLEAGHVATQQSITTLAFTPTKLRTLPAWLHHAVVVAFGHSLQAVFLAAIPVAAIAVPATLWCRSRPLRTGSFMGEAAALAEGSVRAQVRSTPQSLAAAIDKVQADLPPALRTDPGFTTPEPS
jgi:hypothetical protein